MPTFTIDENTPILVDFKPAAGVVRTAKPSPADLAEQSRKALDAAMNTIHAMAQRIASTVDAMTDRPNMVEVEFGLKLDAQAGALVATASAEASFNVKLTWQRPAPAAAQPEMD